MKEISPLAFFHDQKSNIPDQEFGFNQLYANQSPELNTEYNPEKAEIQFQPILETLNQYFPTLDNTKILEIGGSSGILSRKLQDKSGTVTMLDTEETFVDKAKEQGVNAYLYNGSDLLPIIGGKNFDIIIANRVFEDIVMSEYQSKRLLSQIPQFLNSNGILIIGTQNPNAVWKHTFKATGFKPKKVNSTPWHPYITQVTTYRKK